MKLRLFPIFILIMGLALSLTWTGAAAQEPNLTPSLESVVATVVPPTTTMKPQSSQFQQNQLISATEETLTVPFTNGTAGVQTSQSYAGLVTITISGNGQASGTAWSDAFYIYTDFSGQPRKPLHPTEFYNWSLWINGEPVDYFVQPIPTYNPDHIYAFTINAPGGPLNFAVGDAIAHDNSGSYSITVRPGLAPLTVEIAANEKRFFSLDGFGNRISIEGQSNVFVPFTVKVKRNGQPVSLATVNLVYPDQMVLGHTDSSGCLETFLPVPNPGEQISRVEIEAVESGQIVSTGQFSVYPQTLLRDKRLTIQEGETVYTDKLLKDFERRPGYSDSLPDDYKFLINFFHNLLVWSAELNKQVPDYTPQPKHGIHRILYKVESNYADTAYVYREILALADDTIVHDKRYWSWSYPKVLNLYDAVLRRDAVVITLNSPTTAMLIAPDGKRAGVDPQTGNLVFDFPVAISEPGDEPYVLLAPAVPGGEYTLQVTGTGSGPYLLTVSALSTDGVETVLFEDSSQTKKGQITEYKIDYKPSTIYLPIIFGH